MFIVDATMSDKSKKKITNRKAISYSDLFNNFLRILTVSEKDKEGFRDFNIPEEKAGSCWRYKI